MEDERIEELRIVENYLKNAVLRRKINEGALINVDGLLVLNDKNYVYFKTVNTTATTGTFNSNSGAVTVDDSCVFWMTGKNKPPCPQLEINLFFLFI